MTEPKWWQKRVECPECRDMIVELKLPRHMATIHGPKKPSSYIKMGDRLSAAEARATAAEAALAEIRRVLEMVEWLYASLADEMQHIGGCPWCGGAYPRHKPDCPRELALRPAQSPAPAVGVGPAAEGEG